MAKKSLIDNMNNRIVYDDEKVFGGKAGEGKEGKIYEFESNAYNGNYVVKIYDEKKAAEKRLKIEKMIQLKPYGCMESNIGIWLAWPCNAVYHLNGTFVGYIMPKIKIGTDLNIYFQPNLYAKNHIHELNGRERLILGLQFAQIIKGLHEQNIYGLDGNPKNYVFCQDDKGARLVFVDCDTFEIKVDDSIYQASAFFPDYNAPEYIRSIKNRQPIVFSKEGDAYIYAMILFSILMRGIHPFSGSVRDGFDEMKFFSDSGFQIERENAGYFPYGEKYRDVYCPRVGAPVYEDRVPVKLRGLFEECFENRRRPSLDEWISNLKICIKELYGEKATEKKNPEKKIPERKVDGGKVDGGKVDESKINERKIDDKNTQIKPVENKFEVNENLVIKRRNKINSLVLLLDATSSMMNITHAWEPLKNSIKAMMNSFETMEREQKDFDFSTIDICLMTFGGKTVRIIEPFQTLNYDLIHMYEGSVFENKDDMIYEMTNISNAIRFAVDEILKYQGEIKKQQGVDFYKTKLILLTDGFPEDPMDPLADDRYLFDKNNEFYRYVDGVKSKIEFICVGLSTDKRNESYKKQNFMLSRISSNQEYVLYDGKETIVSKLGQFMTWVSQSFNTNMGNAAESDFLGELLNE